MLPVELGYAMPRRQVSVEPRITITDIARAAGVSHQLVSAALRSPPSGSVRVAPVTAERIRALAAELGYRPNMAARSFRAGNHRRIALLTSTRDGTNVVPPGFVERLHDQLAENGFELSLHRVDDARLVDEAYVPTILNQWSCDGLVITYTCGLPPRLETLVSANRLPAVWVNRQRATDCVLFADRAATLAATRKLAELGHQRIAYIGPAADPDEHHSASERRTGYRQAMRGLRLPPIEPIGDPQRWLSARQRPTAVIGYSDVETCQVAGACLRLGLRVPADVSLMGILNYGPALQLGLAYFELDGLSLGHAAARMIGALLLPDAVPQAPHIVDLLYIAGPSIGPVSTSH